MRWSLTLAISTYKGTISVLHLRFASWLPLQREAGPSICPEGLSRLFARPIISRPATAENIHYWTALYHITQTPTSKAGLKGAETIYKSNISEILAPFWTNDPRTIQYLKPPCPLIAPCIPLGYQRAFNKNDLLSFEIINHSVSPISDYRRLPIFQSNPDPQHPITTYPPNPPKPPGPPCSPVCLASRNLPIPIKTRPRSPWHVGPLWAPTIGP